MLKTQSYETSICVEADSYSLSGNALASKEAKARSVYYGVNRISPKTVWPEIAKDDRMVFWGLSHYILDNLTRKITDSDVLETKIFMDQAHSFGGALPYDWKMMKRVVDEYDGYLPLLIEGLPEGDVFYPHQPMVQVTSLDKDFGELAAHIEACLLPEIALATARASLTAHWWQHLVDKAIFYNVDPTVVDDFIHDFGFRAGFKDESMVLGLAHLMFFNGTDTFNAAFKAWRDGVTTAGKSIPALAHRNVQGFLKEGDCYENAYNVGIVCSQVADCYNFKRAVSKYLVPLALREQNIVVARPDSGDALENDSFVREEIIKNNLFKIGENGYKEPTYLTTIEGNSVKPPLVDKILEERNKACFHPFKGIFGVGGFLRNSCTRDTLSSKWALNAYGLNNQPAMKIAENGKETIPGPIQLWDGICSLHTRNTSPELMYDKIPLDIKQRLIPYYVGGKIAPFVGNFKYVHERAKSTWKKALPSMEREIIVGEVQETINMLKKRYTYEEMFDIYYKDETNG